MGDHSSRAEPETVQDLATPAAVIDIDRLDANIATMATRWAGPALRPHVKAFKSTSLARRLAERGHAHFCCATIAEVEGMAHAGLGEDLLLANEVLDATRLGALADAGARVTVAVDSDETLEAAILGGVGEVLIDVNVGLPRCGCRPDEAPALAERARAAGLNVRGVMGYEGHLMVVEDAEARRDGTSSAMQALREAHDLVGGDVISGGGTGTWDCNDLVTELQAGSFTLMDTAYAHLDLPFVRALAIVGTVISIGHLDGKGGTIAYAVADVGLKSLGMDHGNPSIDGMQVWFCSDEHITFSAAGDHSLPRIGDLVEVWPAHIDPTVAYHDRYWVTRRGEANRPVNEAIIADEWAIDLKGW